MLREFEEKHRKKQQREAEKEKRIAHLVRQSLCRLTRLELAGGFSRWHGHFVKQAWEKRLLLGSARRIKHHSVALGFGAWQEHWEKQVWQRRTLARAVSRLARPQLSAAVASWVGNWRAAEKVRARGGRKPFTVEVLKELGKK